MMRVLSVCVTLILVSGMTACGDDEVISDADTAIDDVADDRSDEGDLATDTPDADGVQAPEPGDPVVVDLSAYLSGDDGDVQVYQATEESEFISGNNADSRPGDYVLENSVARFAIEGNNRVIAPCPFGGNLIDMDIVRGEEEAGGDVLGELCPMLQLGQTTSPDQFAILQTGESGGSGVLAVTSHMEILDFFNLLGMIDGFAPGLITELAIDTEAIAPYTVTVYYVLNPEEPVLQIVTAIRNDGTEEFLTPFLHLIDSGGDIEVFNPLSSFSGFGFSPLGARSLTAEPLSYVAFAGPRTSYAYLPDPDPTLSGELPMAGSYLLASGLVFAAMGNSNATSMLAVPPSAFRGSPGVLTIEPGDVVTFRHRMIVGDGSLSSVVDRVYDLLEVDSGTASGTVTDSTGATVAGARVSAVASDGRAYNHARSDASGSYTMSLPPDSYIITARKPGQPPVDGQSVTVVASEDVEASPVIQVSGRLTVAVSTPDGEAVPARVTVVCVGECESQPTSQEQDITYDPLIDGVAAVGFAGATGEVAIPLAPGDYTVIVSRGPEWSIYPTGALSDGGAAVSISSGEDTSLDAEIAQVVDTTRAVSGDFHIHTINSMDSPILIPNRVLGFVAEGLDVLVSTDHDYITDFAPILESLALEEWSTTMIGQEVTTDTYGHYNGFPLQRDPESVNGGAVDWGNGTDFSLTPEQLFDWFDEHPGEQVIQINHPDRLGMITGLKADVLTGETWVDPARVRLPSDAVDEETGESGLWSDGFTAMEILNGKTNDNMWMRMRWWLTMVGRGFTPTGTAVSDTHSLYGHLGAVPRSYVFHDEDQTTLADLDEATFVAEINRGNLIGTTGPFLSVSASNLAGDEIGLGETITTDGDAVTAQIRIQIPMWMEVDTLEVLMNVSGLRGSNSTPPTRIAPTASFPIEWTEDSIVVVADGEQSHARRETTIEVPLESDEDAYVVFVVSDRSEDAGMSPLVPSSLATIAYTNPFFLDADGGGYDNPPYASAADEKTGRRPLPLLPFGEVRYPTEERLRILLEAVESNSCH